MGSYPKPLPQALHRILNKKSKLHTATGVGQVKPAGLQAPRSCHGKFEKLVRKVGISFAFSMHIGPKINV